jgi:hypothetical protein
VDDRADAAELVRALKRRPSRGGVRLTYSQAALALRLIAAGALAVQRDRARARAAAPAELVRTDLEHVDANPADEDSVAFAREALARSTAPADDPLRQAAEAWVAEAPA